LRVVTRMVADLDLAVEIVPCATVRESDGLAMSSRNRFLSVGDRGRAATLYRALVSVRTGVANGERRPDVLLSEARGLLDADAVDYLEIVRPEDLGRVSTVEGPVLVLGAVRIGGTRLIDNILIGGNA